MRFSADYIQSFTLMNFNMEFNPYLERIIRVRISSPGAFLNHNLSRLLMLRFNKLGLGFLRQVEILAQSFQRMKSIMNTD